MVRNLAVESKSTLHIKVLNLAVWYGIAICIHVRKKFWQIFNLVVVKANCQTF